MTAEIHSTRPVPSSPTLSRPSTVSLAIKLLEPLEGLLAAGESAKAEVVALKEVAQNFQLLLKVTLANGNQAAVQATSNTPIPPGTGLNLTALSQTRLLAALMPPAVTLKSLDLEQVPLGTLLQAKVLSRDEAKAAPGQPPLYKMVVSLLNSALAGRTLSLESALPLPVGSLLTAQVQGKQALNFLPLSSRLDQLEVDQQLQSQQSRQGSLDGLLKSLQNLSSPGQTSALPAELHASVDKLLASLPEFSALGDAKSLSKALEESGVFFEAKLLNGQTQALPQDLKGNLLRLVAQLLPALPGAASTPPNASNMPGSVAQALPVFVRNLLGSIGQSSSRQQALSFPLPARLLQNLDQDADLETLLRLAAAAVSRLQTHQLSGLAQSQTGPEGNVLTTWQLEIPLRNQQDIVPLQVKLQRDENRKKTAKEQAETLWRVELAFDLAPLGPLQVQAQLARGSISSQLWAERPSTASLIDSELGYLRERLSAAGLNVGELACRQGTPPQGQRTSLEQRWIDETA